MSQICSFEDCERVVFKNRQECVLHCEKKDYSSDWKDGVLSNFYKELIDYIINFIFENIYKKQSLDLDAVTAKNYLENHVQRGAGFFKSEIIVFTHIFFPCRDDRDHFDYLKLLRKFQGIHFNYCKFSGHSIDTPQVELFFQDCEFFKYWDITPTKLLGNINSVLYQACVFNEDVDALFEPDEDRVLQNSLFHDCLFKKKLTLSNLSIMKSVFKNTENIVVEIPELQILRCNFESEFLLSDLKTNLLHIEKSIFLFKVEMQKCNIAEAKFIDSEFKSSFDVYGTSFGKFFAATTIFSDFAGFERCEFGKVGDENGVAQFEYVTFLSFANIRNTIFHQGLNLEDTNLKEAPNFLNIQLLSDNTNRETYRIIKHSFDKIGNHIEANRFYEKEMDKYQQSLKDKPISQEKIIFWLNKYSSNFGQSYLLPIFWLFVSWAVYALITAQWATNLLIEHFPKVHGLIAWINDFFNDFFKNAIPFNKLLVKDLEFISLIFYVICASLLWQTIVALKRHTQR